MATTYSRISPPGMLFLLALIGILPVFWWIVVPMLTGAGWPGHRGHLLATMVHVAGGIGMLVLGSAAIFIGWTRRGFRFHRWVGYSYLTVGSVGALAALALSVRAPHPPQSLYLATGTLSVVWLAAAGMAWRAARNRRFQSHREWMIRSYVLTWTFVGCRLATRVDLYPWLGEESATAAIWINWVVPLFVCEVVLRWREGAAAPAGRHG